MTAITFDNIGFIRKKIPDKLFQSLKEECSYVENLRSNNIDDPNYYFETNIESNNQTKHYSLKTNTHLLKEYLLGIVREYNEAFPTYIYNIRVLNTNVPWTITDPWINVQSKGEFLPLHEHGGVYSYSIWIKIPYSYEDENSASKHTYTPHNGAFEFIYANSLGHMSSKIIPLSSEDEGYLIMFPSKMNHIVYPFFKANGYKISISGNIILDTSLYGN